MLDPAALSRLPANAANSTVPAVDVRIGVIDLGSNSVRLVIYQRDGHGVVYERDNIKRMLRLGAHLDESGAIDEIGQHDALESMRQFAAVCAARGVSEIVAVATAAVRQATNGPTLLLAIEDETGIRVRSLSGEEEARYGYVAVVGSMAIRDALTIDIGGGSAEITLIRGRERVASTSLPLGVLNLSARFLTSDPASHQSLIALRQSLDEALSAHPWLLAQGVPLIAIGGTARALAKFHQRQRNYPFASFHYYEMTRQELEGVYLQLAGLSTDDRRDLDGLTKDRAETMVAGLAMFRALMDKGACTQLITSAKGLRDGVLSEYLLGTSQLDIHQDVALVSALQLVTHSGEDTKRAKLVARLAGMIFDAFAQLELVTPSPWKRLLLFAALLTDVGRAVDAVHATQHTFYMLTNVVVYGLTHRERLAVAALASFKNGKQLQTQMARFPSMLSADDVRQIEQLGQLVLIAKALERSMAIPVTGVTCYRQKKNVVLHSDGRPQDLVEPEFLEAILDKASKVFKVPLKFKL
jgi:exopolyphosphatase/guanosine-5'-triphosphate,3'-diphosphate pyrophosphatase